MNPRTKSALLILVTLVLGMVLGALLHARLAEQRMERLASLRSHRGFVHYMEGVIAPRDAAQRAAVQSILQETADSLDAHMTRSRGHSRALVDSMKSALRPVLDQAQMQRLEEHLRQRRQSWGRRGGRADSARTERRRR